MGLGSYTGPTSGRITVGGGQPPRTERFYGSPLTADEVRATEWFRKLSPNEQYREARRLKWNADERERQLSAARRTIRKQDRELARLRAKLATFTPEGFSFPPAARELLDHAKAHGWHTAHAWLVDPEDPSLARLQLVMQHGDLREFQITYICDYGGRGYRAGRRTSGLARAPYRGWHSAPSNQRIKEIITEVENTVDA